MERILLVGARRPALEAAERLGLSCALLAEPGAPRRFRRAPGGYTEVSFEAPAAEIEAAGREVLAGGRPSAVAAVTDRALIPAAVLASAFGLPGLEPADAICLRDKVKMKERLRAAGIPCQQAVPLADARQGVDVAETMGFPVVVKPRSSSGSRATVVAQKPEEVRRAVAAIRRTAGSGGAALEPFVRGREISAETFSTEGRVRWTHLTEYLRPGWSSLLPARLEGPLAREVQDLAGRALAACGIGWGMIHTEFYLTADGPVVGEVNARPPGGGLMDLLGLVYGFDAWGAALGHLMATATVPALAEPLPTVPRVTAGNLFIHPGSGVVEKVQGWQEVCALPGVVDASLRLKPGDRLGTRVGTGQSRGFVVVAGEDPEGVVETLTRAEGLLKVSLL